MRNIKEGPASLDLLLRNVGGWGGGGPIGTGDEAGLYFTILK
jgi:hypothetical protein